MKTLADYVSERTRKVKLQDGILYHEPRLSSGGAIGGNPKMGEEFRAKTKKLARRGDLIIATLHTHRGQGLFAFADRDYVCQSQLVLESLLPQVLMEQALRVVLPTLTPPADDIVKRETFKAAQILALPMPDSIPPEIVDKAERAQLCRERVARFVDEVEAEAKQWLS